MRTEISKVKFVATKISMSQQTSQPAIRTREEKSVATKENSITRKIAKESKKSYLDRVDKLKRKILVPIKKIMSRQFPDAKVHKELGANKFCVATQDIPIATLSKSVAIESKKKLREQVTTKNCRLQQKPTTKTKDSVAKKLSMSR